MANINADGFDWVELTSGNDKVADIKADWVKSRMWSRVIVDAVSLKLDVFTIKATTFGQVGYKPEKKNPLRPIKKASV